ncbi:MAG: C40 family peptidase [Flavobacteriaceae bacterium]|nr:C40 family peptidase [Flavobacteriaceae bacterium]
MPKGIGFITLAPLRSEPADTSELVSQLVYGESFDVLEKRKNWSRIALDDYDYEAWIDNKQYRELSEEQFEKLQKHPPLIAQDLLSYVSLPDASIQMAILGSNLAACSVLGHRHEANATSFEQPDKSKIIEHALLLLNAPYLWGGKSPLGIDCSGFTQLVYASAGMKIPRDAYQQAQKGEILSFIEEAEAGDLAFFDNSEGKITHVGIILKQNYIIHAHGCVRIDRIDQSGIYNPIRNQHTHQLRIIKKLI